MNTKQSGIMFFAIGLITLIGYLMVDIDILSNPWMFGGSVLLIIIGIIGYIIGKFLGQ